MEDLIPLSFGKYKGQTPEDVADGDPSYIAWLYENVPGNVSRELYLACEREKWDDYGYPGEGPDEGDGWDYK